MVCHRPEGLDQLEAQTNFSKRELQVLYRGFKNVSDSYVGTGIDWTLACLVILSSIHPEHVLFAAEPLHILTLKMKN